MPTIRSGPDHGCERNEPRASTTAGSAQWRSSSRTTTGRSRASPSSTARAASSASPVPRDPRPSPRSSSPKSSESPRVTRRASSPVATRSASAWIRRRPDGVADPGVMPAISPMALAKGDRATCVPYAVERPARTRASGCRLMNSDASRVLPAPASPLTITTRARRSFRDGSELRRKPLEMRFPIHELGADEGRRSPCRERGAGRSGLVRHDRLRLPLRDVRATPSVADRVPRPTPGPLLDQDGAGRSEVGQARCRVDDVADHRDPRRLGGRAHHHLAGVDAGVDLGDRETGTALVQLADAFANGEGGAYRPFGVVLVRDGNPEDGHEAVALDLRHGPPVILDHPLEVRQRRPDEGEDLLRVERRCEGRVPGEVREEQRDELALSTGLRHPTCEPLLLRCPPSPRACRRPPGTPRSCSIAALSSSMSSDPSSTNSENRPMTRDAPMSGSSFPNVSSDGLHDAQGLLGRADPADAAEARAMSFGTHGSHAVGVDDGLGRIVGADAEFEQLVVDEPTERRKIDRRRSGRTPRRLRRTATRRTPDRSSRLTSFLSPSITSSGGVASFSWRNRNPCTPSYGPVIVSSSLRCNPSGSGHGYSDRRRAAWQVGEWVISRTRHV